MVILLESSKITMQVTNHFRYIWWFKPVFFLTDKYLFFIHWYFDNFDWDPNPNPTNNLRWLPTIPENVKLLRTHSPVIKFILNTPKTGQCEYFQEKHEGHCCTYNEK